MNKTANATTEITERNLLAGIQKILREYCEDDVSAELAYDKLNDLLKFDKFNLRIRGGL